MVDWWNDCISVFFWKTFLINENVIESKFVLFEVVLVLIEHRIFDGFSTISELKLKFA